MKKWQNTRIKDFFRTILKLKDEKELSAFMRDVATLSELTEMAKRWEAVQLINKKTPYREVSEKTGLSTTTVSRVAYWLRNGEGGYDTALKKV